MVQAMGRAKLDDAHARFFDAQAEDVGQKATLEAQTIQAENERSNAEVLASSLAAHAGAQGDAQVKAADAQAKVAQAHLNMTKAQAERIAMENDSLKTFMEMIEKAGRPQQPSAPLESIAPGTRTVQ